MPTPTPTLTTLPPEILLQIADHFLEDYLLWKTQLKYLRKATFHLDICPYINLARTHRDVWNVLIARRFARGLVEEAEGEKRVPTTRLNCEGARRRHRRLQAGIFEDENGEERRKPDRMEWCELLKEG